MLVIIARFASVCYMNDLYQPFAEGVSRGNTEANGRHMCREATVGSQALSKVFSACTN